MTAPSEPTLQYELYPIDPQHKHIEYLIDFMRDKPRAYTSGMIMFHGNETTMLCAIQDDKPVALLCDILGHDAIYFGWWPLYGKKAIEILDIKELPSPESMFYRG